MRQCRYEASEVVSGIKKDSTASLDYVYCAQPINGPAVATDLDDLAAFLLEAKRRTYAGLDDEATVAVPLLGGSKQLEHRSGSYAYRDIYFGMGFFVGQETVSLNAIPIWSMSYSGGTAPRIADRPALLHIYAFLRRALLMGSIDRPYRGPEAFAADGWQYSNSVEGGLVRFSGIEEIVHSGDTVYTLRYSGGLLR